MFAIAIWDARSSGTSGEVDRRTHVERIAEPLPEQVEPQHARHDRERGRERDQERRQRQDVRNGIDEHARRVRKSLVMLFDDPGVLRE